MKEIKLSWRIAFGGIAAALSSTLMAISGFMPGMKYTLALLAGMPYVALIVLTSAGNALCAYAASVGVVLLVCRSPLSLCAYIFIFGIYPPLRAFSKKIRKRFLGLLSVAVIFQLCTGGALLCFRLFTGTSPSDVFFEIPLWLLWIGLNGLMIFYDIFINAAERELKKHFNFIRKKL